MKKFGNMVAAGLVLAASAAFADDKGAGDNTSSTAAGYDVVEVLGAGFGSGIYSEPCDGPGECTAPYIDLEGQVVSAILQSRKDRTFVSCLYEQVKTKPGSEALFDHMNMHFAVGAREGALSAADALRPPIHQKSGRVEAGSCVPVESEMDVDDIRQSGSWRVLGIGLGTFGIPVSEGMGQMSVSFDRARERRLGNERVDAYMAGKKIFPLKEIDHDPDWRFYMADGAPCPNTGDFSVAEEIVRHQKEKTIMPDVPLRGACPKP